MKLKQLMPYVVDIVSLYHEPRNDTVRGDLFAGTFDLDSHIEYDRCLSDFGDCEVAESGVWSTGSTIRIMIKDKRQ